MEEKDIAGRATRRSEDRADRCEGFGSIPEDAPEADNESMFECRVRLRIAPADFALHIEQEINGKHDSPRRLAPTRAEVVNFLPQRNIFGQSPAVAC